MIVDVIMPKMGESIMEGTVLEWRVKVGDTIRKDAVLLEISTDKVDSEIPSPAEGTITEILIKPQETVDVGVVIARIATEGETAAAGTAVAGTASVAEAPAKKQSKAKTPPDADSPTATPKAPLPPPPALAPLEAPPVTGNGSGRRKFFTPLVKTIAGKEGVSEAELATIAGSGRGGRVNKADLLAYLQRRQSGAVPIPASAAAAPLAEPAPMGDLIDEVVPMDRIRQRIAQHMRQSLDTATHVYGISESDVSAMVGFRSRQRGRFLQAEGIKLTYTPLIAFATLRAIRDFPLMNAHLDGTDIVKRRNINLGIAVSLPDNNLIVAVVQRAEELNFLGLARQIADLAQRARSGDLQPDEAAGSTFTITNPGLFGNLIGLPIINQPNVGILSVGAIKKRPVVWETEGGDAIVIRSMMLLALGHDHRLIDGAYGAQFLERVVHYLQTLNWEALL